MASAADFLRELQGANGRLDGVNARLDDVKVRLDAVKASTDAVRSAVEQVNGTLQWGFTQLIVLGVYTNEALAQNARQNETIICILEQIARHTCDLVNQSHLQTGLQKTMNESTTALSELYAATHAEAALSRERIGALRAQLEACCPPPRPEPACREEQCPKTEQLREPPRVDLRPNG